MPLFTRPAVLLLVVCTVFVACKEERKVTRSYYFWQNSTWLEREEKQYLKEHNINRLYTKLMDIDWHEVYHAYPLHINEADRMQNNFYASDSISPEIVPVIFITNKTFTRIDSSEIHLLATRILRKCFQQYDSTDIESEKADAFYFKTRQRYMPAEIQFDCDWTTSTASKYFYFLNTVRKLLPSPNIKVSATIRLHQFKYPGKTGVPPVDRGMLMVYNITDLTKYSPVNSIFDYDKARQYFTRHQKYPLPLDIALPAYSWSIIYRNKKFYQIENELTKEELEKHDFLQPSGDHFFAVTKDTVFRNLYLRPGDEIKPEQISEAALLQAARLAAKSLNTDSLHVALFDLSTSEIKNFSHETIEQVYNNF